MNNNNKVHPKSNAQQQKQSSEEEDGDTGSEESTISRFVPGCSDKIFWKDLPEDDTDNPPSIGKDAYPQYQGYEDAKEYNTEVSIGPPQSSENPVQQSSAQNIQYVDDSDLSPEDVREAMAKKEAQTCCYGNRVSKEMVIQSIEPTTAIHYTLETFCETRTISRKICPYTGQSINGPENGPPPPPWSVKCPPKSLFKNHTRTTEVPHTAFVKKCYRCSARGFLRCHTCNGRGKTWCTVCRGDGKLSFFAGGAQHKKACKVCKGLGWNFCELCDDDGRETCPVCTGYKQVKHYMAVTATFKTHQSEHIVESTDMPDELVLYVSGVIVFEQVQPRVLPITNYPHKEVTENSENLVNLHNEKYSAEKRILQQRQILRGVPVTEVVYHWKGVERRYWVFGKERQVHTLDYPQQCCCGCAII